MIRLRGRHWLLGGGIALLLYLGMALALLWRPPAPLAVDPGVGSFEIALGPAGGGVGGGQADPGEATGADEAEPEPNPEPESKPELVPEILPESEPVPEPEHEPEPAPAPRLQPRATVEPATKASAPTTPPATALPRNAATEGLNTGSSGEGQPAGGDEEQTPGGGETALPDDYLLRLQSWLERHKDYPRQARRRRLQGTVLLFFVMSREGKVLHHEIRRSSGYKMLDREAQAMIERAQPLPPLPVSVSGAQLELLLPVRFALR